MWQGSEREREREREASCDRKIWQGPEREREKQANRERVIGEEYIDVGR